MLPKSIPYGRRITEAFRLQRQSGDEFVAPTRQKFHRVLSYQAVSGDSHYIPINVIVDETKFIGHSKEAQLLLA